MTVNLELKSINHEVYSVSKVSFVFHFLFETNYTTQNGIKWGRFFLSLSFNKFSLNFAKNFYVKLFEYGPNDKLIRVIAWPHTYAHISHKLWCDKSPSKFIFNSCTKNYWIKCGTNGIPVCTINMANFNGIQNHFFLCVCAFSQQ